MGISQHTPAYSHQICLLIADDGICQNRVIQPSNRDYRNLHCFFDFSGKGNLVRRVGARLFKYTKRPFPACGDVEDVHACFLECLRENNAFL
ncbi:hypothetical protein D3C81_1994400 [compost metagenome]